MFVHSSQISPYSAKLFFNDSKEESILTKIKVECIFGCSTENIRTNSDSGEKGGWFEVTLLQPGSSYSVYFESAHFDGHYAPRQIQKVFKFCTSE